MFTTVDRIRLESWFNNNSDITDNNILAYWTQANAILLWYIWSIYDISSLSWTLFTWSQAEDILSRIEELYSSGSLLMAEYWPNAYNTDKDWSIKIKEARDLCDMIVVWTIRLFDINWNEFWKKNTSLSWNIKMTTPDDNINLTPIFTISQKF